MEERFTYAELCRMTKKRVIRIAGFRNIKGLLDSGFNKSFDGTTTNASKKYIANIIASDR